MPATCDGGDNDARDQQNEDDSRYISQDALRAGNIGPIGERSPLGPSSCRSYFKVLSLRPRSMEKFLHGNDDENDFSDLLYWCGRG